MSSIKTLEDKAWEVRKTVEHLHKEGWDESGPDYGLEDMLNWFDDLFEYADELEARINALEYYNGPQSSISDLEHDNGPR